MKRKTIIAILPFFILSFLITDGYSSSKEIKQRMLARLPVIKSLKDKGLVGENNKGYLEFIGKKKEQEDVVEAENSDRKQVYEAIAKQQSTTVEVVGKHRAVQIADKAQPGEWLQDANGKWYQKK
ncbi:MAG: YdbL family protein [Desulfobacterales bacterium]|nr:MAG: YdbL family protein [Desulfobacterales bacterium]